MANNNGLNNKLSQKTNLFGLKLWVLIGVAVGLFIVVILFLLSLWLVSRKKSRLSLSETYPMIAIPADSKDIQEVKVDRIAQASGGGVLLAITDTKDGGEVEKVLLRVGVSRKVSNESGSSSSFKDHAEKQKQTLGTPREEITANIDRGLAPGEHLLGSMSGRNAGIMPHDDGLYPSGELQAVKFPMSWPVEDSHFGWGHWFTLRDLQIATHGFSRENVLGEGGYGVVYRGQLTSGTMIAVKSLLNNMGQAEREFRVEVEAIGRVRHKNLVRLLGYCMEGTHRMLVYDYVDNGNLEQWLHGDASSTLTWDIRMKIVLGTAKALAYLHEALEPKVVHRDIKASNILIDTNWNAKVSDFGLAKLLMAGKSHVTTRVMGTFGYVAPEYASTGMLNERSDVYSFGVLLMETITGRDPVDYARPPGEVNLVDWMKVMVGNRLSEEVIDPNLIEKPAARILKKTLLVALRCVDPESEKRPKMGHVVHMLESDDFPHREVRRLPT